MTGFISYRGRGPEVTTIKGNGDRGVSGQAFYARDCASLSIQDMTFFGDGPWTVQWNSGGSSTWSHVVIINDSDPAGDFLNGNAWYDDCTGEFEQSVHYIFGSRLESRGVNSGPSLIGWPATIGSLCTQMWIYGSDIVRKVNSTPLASGVFVGHYPNPQNFSGDVRLFGTSVRVSVENSSTPVAGITASANGIVHMHGGIVNVTPAPGATSSFDVVGIRVLTGGFVHTPETAFNLGANNGVVRRLENFGGSILSPFLWQVGTRPPTQAGETSASPSGDFLSETGQDMFVETDCNSAGDCDGSTSGANEPHLMIYAAQCGTANPWFDTVTGACRP